MRYLTFDKLTYLQACTPAKEAFTQTFGLQARITIKNIKKFEEQHPKDGVFWVAWLCSEMFTDLHTELQFAFLKQANVEPRYISSFYQSSCSCAKLDEKLQTFNQKRRATAFYQLLKVL